MQLPSAMNVFDVCCRDGLQMEKQFIPTEEKITIINGLSKLGFKKLEITSFVSPKAVPQMSDAADVASGIARVPGVIYSALVPNVKGAQRAIDAGIDELNVVFSASESHNLSNLRMPVDKSLQNVSEIIALARGCGTPVNVSIATAFGCPFEGKVDRSRVFSLAEQVLSMGAGSLTFADTTGVANPRQVYSMMAEFKKRHPEIRIALHFHNTRGMGTANILAGLQAGVLDYDASLGGLGGCPFAPGASGNVATEDVIHMAEEMGVKTGIDLDGLIELGRYLEQIIGRTLPGQVLKSGKVSDLHAAKWHC